MKRLLLVALLFCLSSTALAVEVGGVVLEDSAHLGNSNLLLNGAGVRSKVFFRFVYRGAVPEREENTVRRRYWPMRRKNASNCICCAG